MADWYQRHLNNMSAQPKTAEEAKVSVDNIMSEVKENGFKPTETPQTPSVQPTNVETKVETPSIDTTTEQQTTTATPTTPTTLDYDEYAGLDDVAKKRAQGIMQAENLQAQIDAARWAEETPEQQTARLKKERRERNLAGALGLLGAMGNFAVAAAHPSGRSVPVANISDAVEKRQTAAQKERELALGKLKGARGRRAQILEQGYADTEKRKQLAEQEAYRKSQLEMQNKQLARQEAKDMQDFQFKLANLKIAQQKADSDAGNAKARQALYYAQREYYNQRKENLKKNGGGTGKYKGFIFNDGKEVIDIPETRYNNTIYHAFAKLPSDLQNQALSMIYQDMLGGDAAKVDENLKLFAAMDKAKKQHWITKRATEMNAALEAIIDDPKAKEALQVLKNASNAQLSKSDIAPSNEVPMEFETLVEDPEEQKKEDIVFDN